MGEFRTSVTQPDGHDEYYTCLKVKYLQGIVTSNATFSVATAGVNVSSPSYAGAGSDVAGDKCGKLPCDATFPVISSTGTTYYVPLFRYG